MGAVGLLVVALIFGGILNSIFNSPAKKEKRKEKEAQRHFAQMQEEAHKRQKAEAHARKRQNATLISQFTQSAFTNAILSEIYSFAEGRQITCIGTSYDKAYVEVAAGVRDNILLKDVKTIHFKNLG